MITLKKIVTENNFIQILLSESFGDLKLGDSKSKLENILLSLEFKEIKNKYFHMISYGNVELTFINDLLYSIHYEVNKPNINKIYDFRLTDFNDVKFLLLDNNVTIQAEKDNELIELKNIKMYFENKKLIDLYFQSE